MLSPCLLVSILFTVARSYSTSRHSGDAQQNPTCEQLREFWDEINQIALAAEMTNEIPILPIKFQNAVDRVLMGEPLRNPQRGKSNKKILKDKFPSVLDFTNPFLRYSMPLPQQLLPPPNNFFLSKQQAPLNEELNGVFGEFHEQIADEQNVGPMKHQATKSSDRHHTKLEVASPSVSLGNKKNGEIEFFIPQWGLPEDVDSFGSFVDLDFSSPYLPMTRTPKGVKGQWSDISHNELQTCDAVVDSNCRTKDDCSCKGYQKLTCIQGKCLTHANHEDVEGKYGIWHDGPIPHSELQLLSRHQKRSYKSIFM